MLIRIRKSTNHMDVNTVVIIFNNGINESFYEYARSKEDEIINTIATNILVLLVTGVEFVRLTYNGQVHTYHTGNFDIIQSDILDNLFTMIDNETEFETIIEIK